MSGKKYGLDEKYKALGVGPRTVSINPMQDDLKKLKGMTAAIGAPSKFMQRSLTLKAGASKGLANNLRDRATALRITAARSNVKETIKKFLTSKTNIGATAGAAGYEIGKSESEAEGKKYGGSMKKKKVTKANLGLLMSNKKIAGAGLLGLGMLAKKKFSKGGKSGKRKA